MKKNVEKINLIAKTPDPPYYAVIFSSIQSDELQGYEEMANLMLALVEKQDGFLGFESARNSIGISISYWTNIEAIQQWKNDVDHLMAQKFGKEIWYHFFKVRLAKVERDYEFFNESTVSL